MAAELLRGRGDGLTERLREMLKELGGEELRELARCASVSLRYLYTIRSGSARQIALGHAERIFRSLGYELVGKRVLPS